MAFFAKPQITISEGLGLPIQVGSETGTLDLNGAPERAQERIMLSLWGVPRVR